MLHVPPYALAAPVFPCRALVALAGRAPLGGGREVALGCFMAARLTLGILPPLELPGPLRAQRASNARAWLESLSLEAGTRRALREAVDASGADAADAADALTHLARIVGPQLDGPAVAELIAIAERLRG